MSKTGYRCLYRNESTTPAERAMKDEVDEPENRNRLHSGSAIIGAMGGDTKPVTAIGSIVNTALVQVFKAIW